MRWFGMSLKIKGPRRRPSIGRRQLVLVIVLLWTALLVLVNGYSPQAALALLLVVVACIGRAVEAIDRLLDERA